MVAVVVMDERRRGLRFVPVNSASVVRTSDMSSPDGRLVAAVFGPPECTVCGAAGAAVFVVTADGRWDGSVVCAGESVCALAAVVGYDFDDTEVWTGP